METKLTNDNLSSFFDKYDELKYCVLWKDVGRDLGLKQGEINVIAEDYKDKGTQRCSYEMFLRWISKSENPTLERLLQVITAVERMKILEEGKRAEESVKRLERLVNDWEERNQKLDSDLKSQMADLNEEKSWFLSAQENESLLRETAACRENLIHAIKRPGNYSHDQFVQGFLQSRGYPTSYMSKQNVVEGILRHALLEIDIERSVKMISHLQELEKHKEKLQRLHTEIRHFKHVLEKRLCVYEKIQRGLRELGVSPTKLEKLHDQSNTVEVIVEECKSTVLECDKMFHKAQNHYWKAKKDFNNFTKSFNDNIEVMKQNQIKYNQELLSIFENIFVRVVTFLFGREWELRRTHARARERHVDPQVARQILDYEVTLKEGIRRMEQLRNIT